MISPHIIAQNEWLLAINKPAGLITHSDGRTEEGSLAEWLAENFPAQRGVGGAWVSPQGEAVPLNGLVHRLDRSTSGVILAAKSDDAYEYLKNEFRARRVEKKYLAWVYGKMNAQAGTIIAEIIRGSPAGGRAKHWYARTCPQENPRAAITDWQLVEAREDASLLELSPKTGRTHQLRVHLAHIGFPVVADHVYAPENKTILGFKRPALHASRIGLTLPHGERAHYEAELPQDFQAARHSGRL